jgi:ribonuclease H / adenosylcobalamin/alpha-ribazole phosphatase
VTDAPDTTAPTRVVVEADGGARGNPGPAGFGAVVRAAESGDILLERSGGLGMTTNNVAEYTGLIEGLTAAREIGARDVLVRMDSRLVIEQMSGRWQIKHPGLRPLAAQAAALVHGFDAVRFEWIPRERNMQADALANAAMDGTDAATGSWERSTEPTRLILLRHGATEHTTSGRYSGRMDVPLASLGVAQAEASATRIAQLVGPVAAVLSSPLSRCTDTAEFVCAALPGTLSVTIEPDIIECDFGLWDGQTFADVRAKWGPELTRWLASPAVAPPGGESFRAVTTRTRRFVTSVRANYPGQTVIVVSHVSPIKIMLRDALAAGDAFLHRLHLDAAGISIVDSWSDGGVSVRTVNDTAHLASLSAAAS